MKITVKKKLGNAVLEVECNGKDEKEALAKATFFTQKDICGKCKSQNIVWTSNKAKTEDGMFTYIKRKCLDCGAESTAGEYKEGGLFWKEWTIFKRGEGNQQPKNNDDDIPVIENDEPDSNIPDDLEPF